MVAFRITGGMIKSQSEQPLGTLPYFKQSCSVFKCFVLLEFSLRVYYKGKKKPSRIKSFRSACLLSGSSCRLESQQAIRRHMPCI